VASLLTLALAARGAGADLSVAAPVADSEGGEKSRPPATLVAVTGDIWRSDDAVSVGLPAGPAAGLSATLASAGGAAIASEASSALLHTAVFSAGAAHATEGNATEAEGAEEEHAKLEHAREEGEHEGEEHEKAEGNQAVTITAAASLLGMTASIQLLFYLTNCRMVLVRIMTWRMVSAAISIYAAILVFNVAHEMLMWIGDTDSVPCVKLVVVWIVSQLLMFHVKDDPLSSTAVAVLWGHTTGFFAIADFGHIQEHRFHDSPMQSMGVVGIATGLIVVLCFVTRLLRNWVALAGDGVVDEVEELWMERCEDYEDDVITMTMGFLISQVLRFQASGKLVGHEEEPEGGTPQQIFGLCVWGICFAVCLLVFTGIRAKVDASTHNKNVKRVIGIANNFLGMTAAWTLLFGLRWQYIEPWAARFGSAIPAKLLLALMTSLGAVGVILGLNIMTKCLDDEHDPSPRTLRAITGAVGLMVGLSWETTFAASIEGLAEGGFAHPLLIKVGLSTFLFIVIFPSWEYYILPKTERRLEKCIKDMQVQGDDDDEVAQMEKALEESGDEASTTHDEDSQVSEEEFENERLMHTLKSA